MTALLTGAATLPSSRYVSYGEERMRSHPSHGQTDGWNVLGGKDVLSEEKLPCVSWRHMSP